MHCNRYVLAEPDNRIGHHRRLHEGPVDPKPQGACPRPSRKMPRAARDLPRELWEDANPPLLTFALSARRADCASFAA
jgi:hypothetical protein